MTARTALATDWRLFTRGTRVEVIPPAPAPAMTMSPTELRILAYGMLRAAMTAEHARYDLEVRP